MDHGQRRRLDNWLRKQLFGREEKCKRLLIRHAEVSGKVGSDIDGFDVSEKTADDIDLLITEIDNACIADADGTREAFQRYMVYAIGGESERPMGRIPLNYASVSDFDDEEGQGGLGSRSEPATKQGIVAQHMRHNEAIMKLAVGSTAHVISSLNQTIRQQQDQIGVMGNQINAMTSRHMEHIALVEELASRKHERDIETKNAELKADATGEIVQKLLLLFPAIVNRIGGATILPEQNSPAELMIRGLLNSFEDSQIEGMMKVLKPEQQIVMAQFMIHMKENEDKAEKEKAKLAIVRHEAKK